VRQLLASPARSLILSNSADEWFQQRLRWAEALSQARGAAERNSHDTYAQIWLGVLLSMHAKDAEAAEVLQRGLETAVANPRPWLALVSLFDRTGATEDARRVLERLERQVPLPPWQRHFVLGQGFELTADQALAQKHYLQVADNTPYAVEARARANKMVRQESGPTQTTTVSAGSIDAARDAAGIADRRLKAVMHLRRGGKNDVVKARSLLEQLTASGHAESEDRLLLAKIYEEEGQFANARQQFQELLEQDPAAQYVAVYVEFLLRRGNFAAAEPWLDQLEQAPPMARSSVWLRTRWLAGQGRHAEATTLVDAYAARKLESMSTAAESRGAMTEVADTYLAAGMPAAAEQWLRRLAAQFPDETERLARHLVDNDAVEQAIELCLKTLRENSSPESATLLARVLVFGNPSPETQAAAEVILAAALEEFPRDGSLLFAVGNLRLKQNRIDEAIELLQRTTECSPGHYLAWNNLAVLLAEQRGPDSEALAAIERALHVAGYNMPTLLDTKAVVLLHANQFQDAVALLEKVTASPLGNDARYFFHLAVAYHRVGASQSARQALQEANSLGLPETFLTPQEQVLLRRLSDEYAL
jgi:tetratricopeptide (TPR) repeat protein